MVPDVKLLSLSLAYLHACKLGAPAGDACAGRCRRVPVAAGRSHCALLDAQLRRVGCHESVAPRRPPEEPPPKMSGQPPSGSAVPGRVGGHALPRGPNTRDHRAAKTSYAGSGESCWRWSRQGQRVTCARARAQRRSPGPVARRGEPCALPAGGERLKGALTGGAAAVTACDVSPWRQRGSASRLPLDLTNRRCPDERPASRRFVVPLGVDEPRPLRSLGISGNRSARQTATRHLLPRSPNPRCPIPHTASSFDQFGLSSHPPLRNAARAHPPLLTFPRTCAAA
eukprot:365600-Chlamydomonas_euryale.AAC.10